MAISQLRTGFYRVRDANNNTFSLVELDTRQNVDTSDTTVFTVLIQLVQLNYGNLKVSKMSFIERAAI